MQKPEPSLDGETKFQVIDPFGTDHIVIKTFDSYWYGMENLANNPAANARLRELMNGSDMGEWGGYSWLRL